MPILFGLKTFFTSMAFNHLNSNLYITLNNSLINNQNLLIYTSCFIGKNNNFNVNSINSIPRFEIWDKAYNLIIRRPY